MVFTLLLFILTVCAVWVRDVQLLTYKVAPWIILLMIALVSSMMKGYLEWSAIVAIAFFGLLAWTTRYTKKYKIVRTLHVATICMVALLLGLGQLPGFHNPDVVMNVRFSAEGLPFTQRLRIDGISVGIILLAIFCKPARTKTEWLSLLRNSMPIMLMAVVVVMGCGLALNYVSIDIKFIPYTLVFLIVNLLFTCVMEESFFRGLLQDNFSELLATWRYGAYAAVILTALLFGLVHYKGGLLFVGLATLAGLFYGYAKYRVKHIEAAILTHFSMNAVHVIVFTYPNF